MGPRKMNLRQEKSALFIRDAIGRSLIPRNQIASISGLTNTYIRDLEQGNIANVSRDKLLKFSTAVGLDLEKTDEMLALFDRAQLNADDIPIFIKNAKQRRIGSIVHTARDFFGYELLLLAAESLPGPKILFTNHPTAILQPEGLRTYLAQKKPTHHPIHDALNEAVGKERRANLLRQMQHYTMHHFISKTSLERYVLDCPDPEERSWKAQHLKEILNFIKANENFRYYLTEVENGFNFLLKCSDTTRKAQRVFFYSHDLFLMQGRLEGQIIGFYTGNPVIVEQFKKDADIAATHVLKGYQSITRLEALFLDVIQRAGKQV